MKISPLVPGIDAAQDLHQGRLAGAVLAEQHMDLARPHVEVDPIQRVDAGKPLRDAAHRERELRAVGVGQVVGQRDAALTRARQAKRRGRSHRAGRVPDLARAANGPRHGPVIGKALGARRRSVRQTGALQDCVSLCEWRQSLSTIRARSVVGAATGSAPGRESPHLRGAGRCAPSISWTRPRSRGSLPTVPSSARCQPARSALTTRSACST